MYSFISILALTALASAESMETMRSVLFSTLPCPTCVSMPSGLISTSGFYSNSTSAESESDPFNTRTLAPDGSLTGLLSSTMVESGSTSTTSGSMASGSSTSGASEVDPNNTNTLAPGAGNTGFSSGSSTTGLTAVDPNDINTSSSGSAKSTIYDTETVQATNTIVKTITSCDSMSLCTVITRTDAETVVTTTVNGIETIYTTTCPESEISKATNAADASLVMTVVTTTIGGLETIYTTYCPESKTSTVAPGETASPVTPASKLSFLTVLATLKVYVTVTSCSDNECSEVISTSTAMSTVTVPATGAPGTTASPSAVAPGSVVPKSLTGTVNVIPPQISTISMSSSAKASSSATVEVANVAGSNKATGSALFLGVAAMLLL